MPLALIDDILTFTPASGPAWHLPLTRLVIIAELTTDYGPDFDEWLMVFVDTAGTAHYAGLTEQCTEPLAQLRQQLNVQPDLVPQLWECMHMHSRILHPAALREQPLFDFADADPATLPSRLARLAAGEHAPDGRTLTTAVRAFLAPLAPERANHHDL